MEDYNFFADLLSTFRSLNDWIKALIIVGLYASITVCILGVIRRKPKRENSKPETPNVKLAIEPGETKTIDALLQEPTIAMRDITIRQHD